ncbi:MAG TPA: hypothetical protein VGZ71_07080, partial [Puia sp.]|nr:hypothetical protein [Puia sp.]
MKNLWLALAASFFFLEPFYSIGQNSSLLQYPLTEKTNQADDYHGTKVPDPYRWLENDTSAETKAWVQQENKLTFGYLGKIPFRDRLRQRI